jgi:L-seryl-tRNA(Ser) seleniumtransferase
MVNISVNELVESSNSEIPRELKISLAKNLLSVTKDPKEAKKEFDTLIKNLNTKKQREIINATGTILHTNLGRSPVDISYSGMYTNIEYDLTTGSRGNRNNYLTESMKTLLKAENVAFVNNNASSLYLSLLCLSRKYGKDSVIVSRGEIIEIGGSYRLPDIISETGLKLIEVGTTNKTRKKDYEDALKMYPKAVLLKVHRSNFSMSGFTEEVDIEDLVDLKKRYDTLLLHDLGSGLVIDTSFLTKHNLTIFEKEPRVQQSIKDGSDIVMFSGDKLFGSVQSGIIAGNSEIVDSIKNFSIFRTYRCSAIVLSELQKTTEIYLKKLEKNIPFWSLLTEQYVDLEKRIKKITKNINHNFEIITGVSIIGGGTLPNVTLKSPVLVLNISETDKILTELLGNEIPIIPRVANGKINLDLRSVFENQDSEITKFLNSI